MAANSSVGQNNPTRLSPESAESSSAANDEEFFDVWLIKGIRIFWNFNTKTTQKKYLVSWLGYPWWHDTWEPRENIGEGCNDLVAHIERAAALGSKPAVGTEWLAPEDWLKMEEKRRLQSATDRGSQAKIDEARRLEEEDRQLGDPMGTEHGKAIRVAAKQNLTEYEKYKAERSRRKQRPPAPPMKTQVSFGNPATNKEYRRWFRRTRRSTRSQGYFHYSGDDQELAEMTTFTTPSGKATVSGASAGGNKKRRRNAESSSGENQANPSLSLIGASEGSDDDVPLVRVAKRKPRVSVPRKKKDAHVEGPPKKKQRVDTKPKLPTPPPDSETSDAEVPLIKQKKSHVIQSSSDEDEPLAIRARKNKTQMATSGDTTPLSILNQHTPTPQPNPKVTPNPNTISTRSVTLPSTAGPRAQAKRSATGPLVVTPAVPLSPTGDNSTTQNNPPLSSYLRPLDSGPIVKDGVGWFPVRQAVNRKQYVGTSSKQQGPSLGTRARMLGEAPAVGRNRQVGPPSNITTATKAPKHVPVSSRPRIATSASQPSKSAENSEEDLFGDNELEGDGRPADNMDTDMGFTIDVSEPIVVESPAPPPPKPSGPAPAVASKAAQLEVETTSFLTDFMDGVAPSQPESPRSGPQKGPRRIGLYFGSFGCERLCEVYLANVSTPGLQSAHLTKWIFPPGENHAIYLNKLYSASHAPLILPALEPLQWARLEPWDQVDTPTLCAVKDWLSEANQFAIRELPNKPALNICIFSPRCKPIFDNFPKANPNYREDQGLVLVLLKRRFRPPQDAPPRETPEPLLKLPREVSHQDPDISRGLMLLKLTQNTLETWKTAWQRFKKPLTFSLFTMETILFRKNLDPKTPEKLLYGDQLPAHDHAAWRLKHQPETKALLKILELAQLKPWHLMERSDITFIHNNSWELLKKLPGLDDRLGRPHIQFFAFGPHHNLSPDKWGIREVFKRGAVVTFTARSIAENGETFKELVERTHKSPISVAYVTPLTVALVEQMVTDVQLYPNNLESLRFLLDAILDSRISLMTAPPYSWKHDDMNKWRDMQFTFGTDESQLRDPSQASVSSLDKGTVTTPQYRTYDSILTACAKELESIQQEQSIPWNDVIEAGFRQLDLPPPHGLINTTTTKGTPKTALQLEADVNTFLYSDLRLIQSNHFYQTEYRHFVVVESKDSTVFGKEKVVDSVAHLTADEALRLVDPVTRRRTNTA